LEKIYIICQNLKIEKDMLTLTQLIAY